MHSRLLRDLDAAIRNSTDRLGWARNVCRRASHFARQGHTQEALAAIQQVRAAYTEGLEPEAAAWLMLAEGILRYFEQDLDGALDRTRRAYGIAVACQLMRARATCAAWLAFCEFNLRQLMEMGKHLSECLSTASPDDHQAHARSSLVVADGYNLAGRTDLARPWYERARVHATAEGDDATLSALLYNIAAFRVANARLADALEGVTSLEASRALLEASSAASYDSARGTSGLGLLMPYLQAQVLTVSHDYEKALASIAAVDIDRLLPHVRPVPQVDRLWCLANLGRLSQATLNSELPAIAVGELKDPDDLAYVHGRIAQLLAQAGEGAQSSKQMQLARQHLADHRTRQEELREILDLTTGRVD